MIAIRVCAALLLMLVAALSHAHSSSTAYLTIDREDGGAFAVSYRLALRDADALLDLDANQDGQLTWGEVEDRGADLVALADSAIRLETGEVSCALRFAGPEYAHDRDAGFVVFAAHTTCGDGRFPLVIRYHLFAGIDASHRALLFTGGSPPRPLAPESITEISAGAEGVRALIGQGVTHILGGADHLLFLLTLILPAVLTQKNGTWQPRTELWPALRQVIWIATAFTIAHSLTLGLASFRVVRIPSSVIEPLVALTVLLAALNNVWPLVRHRLAALAFAFGTVHGFAFAEVLAPVSLSPRETAIALVAFNGGVELGQLIILAIGFALLAAMRDWRGYSRWVLGGGSIAVAIVAVGWILQRTLDLPVVPL